MFPNTDEMPSIPYTALNSNHILIDMIYNPEETLFLKEGKKRGAFTINGMTMFLAQAEASYLEFRV
jgi:shikimate dehydrogenase